MIELSILQIQAKKLPLPGVNEVVRFLLPNNYVVVIRQTHNQRFVVDGYARFRSEQVRDYIPYVAGVRELEAQGLRRFLLGINGRNMVKLGSRDKVGVRNEICEVARCEPLANQGIRSAIAEHILPFHAISQRIGRNVVNVLESMRNFVPRP